MEDSKTHNLPRKSKNNYSYRAKKREVADRIVGPSCCFCGYDVRLIVHRKDGTPHERFDTLSISRFTQELQTGQYARVCFKCHKAVHWAMKYLGMTWEEMTSRTNPR